MQIDGLQFRSVLRYFCQCLWQPGQGACLSTQLPLYSVVREERDWSRELWKIARPEEWQFLIICPFVPVVHLSPLYQPNQSNSWFPQQDHHMCLQSDLYEDLFY